MTSTTPPSGLSRRRLFGLGAATAGVVATGSAKSAFATESHDRPEGGPESSGDIGGIGTVDHFTSAITRVPNTLMYVATGGDFHGNDDTVTLPGDGRVHATTPGLVEAALHLPVGATIRRIDVFGYRSALGSSSWSVQRYNPGMVGGVGDQTASTLYNLVLNGTGELTGSLPIPAAGLPVIDGIKYAVYLNSTSSTNTATGVICQYDLPPAPPKGFFPINPARVYDSRAAAPTPGILNRLQSRVISIKDSRNGAGTVVAADVVPAGATAITYNITATGTSGPNYLSVAPGDAATAPEASALNWNGGYDIANASVAKLDASRQIKVFMGDNTGSSHFIIDVTGYYI